MSEPVLRAGPFREGRIHVLSEQCGTCVFRPGNLMSLQQGRLKDLAQANLDADSALTCHQTLPYALGDAEPAVCRGYYDAYADQVTPLRLAQELDLIVEDQPPKKTTEGIEA